MESTMSRTSKTSGLQTMFHDCLGRRWYQGSGSGTNERGERIGGRSQIKQRTNALDIHGCRPIGLLGDIGKLRVT